MKITKRQLRRLIREIQETGGRIRRGSGSKSPLSQVTPAYRQGYHDAYKGPGSKRRTDDPEYKKGYEAGLADLEAGKPAPEDLKQKRRRR